MQELFDKSSTFDHPGKGGGGFCLIRFSKSVMCGVEWTCQTEAILEDATVRIADWK